MKVSQLIQELQKLEQDCDVVVEDNDGDEQDIFDVVEDTDSDGEPRIVIRLE